MFCETFIVRLSRYLSWLCEIVCDSFLFFLCMKAGGSSGTVFAWDIRWQQQPVIVSGAWAGGGPANSLSESEVWEVQYDSYRHSHNTSNVSSSKILPAMICSEDGILAVVEQGMCFFTSFCIYSMQLSVISSVLI